MATETLLQFADADPFFTPALLADEVVAQADLSFLPALVADFSAGDGSLLVAANKRWPDVPTLAVDSSRKAMLALQKRLVNVRAFECDFLATDCSIRREAKKAVSKKRMLVVLNPPFSYRGGSVRRITVRDHEIVCSVAMAFLVSAASMLRAGSVVLAIVPRSSLKSEKDSAAREHLRSIGSVQVVQYISSSTFKKCRASTALIRVALGLNVPEAQIAKKIESSARAVECLESIRVSLVRGSCPIFMTGKSKPNSPKTLFVHTTDLQDGNIRARMVRAPNLGIRVSGPLVLLARVGKFSIGKLCAENRRRSILLSDCVIALQCDSNKEMRNVLRRVRNAAHLLSNFYCGTGAPYITISELVGFLASLKIHVEQSKG